MRYDVLCSAIIIMIWSRLRLNDKKGRCLEYYYMGVCMYKNEEINFLLGIPMTTMTMVIMISFREEGGYTSY